MKKIISFIQGSACTGAWLLIGMGVFGIFVTIQANTTVWNVITVNADKTVNSGVLTPYIVVFLLIYALLLALRSVYAIVPVLLYAFYVLETVIGVQFLGHMPLSITSLKPGLYMAMPMSLLLLLLGGIGTIVYRVQYNKTGKSG